MNTFEDTPEHIDPVGRIANKTIGIFRKSKNEFYATPPALSRPMLELERFEGDIWEPACGEGALSRVLSEVCGNVISTDLIHRGYGVGGINFLEEEHLRAPNVVTNPPFSLWGAFAEHALRLGARKVVLMHEQKILGNVGTSGVMKRTGLARILLANRRVGILPPGAIDYGHGPRGGSYAWFVWERGHTGDPTVKWFTPEKIARAPRRKVKAAEAVDGTA